MFILNMRILATFVFLTYITIMYEICIVFIRPVTGLCAAVQKIVFLKEIMEKTELPWF